ncbi:hypothetical protein [Nannocystis pusilla]|uniref:5'-methylthioadenosine/S-adenosylhomocysteine nucleosidase family protein n=1 Tax=Nannocystis pusilla TaxID=889268 RepID=UPI003BF425C0
MTGRKISEDKFLGHFMMAWAKNLPPGISVGHLEAFHKENYEQMLPRVTRFVDALSAADVAILIALEEEWDVFWPIAGRPNGLKDEKSGRYYYPFDVMAADGRPYRCIAVCMHTTGTAQAVDASHLLLEEKPKTLVNIGIAAAIHSDLRLGDVIVADQVDNYLETTKATATGRKGFRFEFRGSVYKTTYSFVQDALSLKYAHPEAFDRWCIACRSPVEHELAVVDKARREGLLREVPRLERVHLASGPTVGAAESFSKWIQSRDSQLKALEMEAGGMMLAAHQRRDPASTLVLRGISDFGDRRKTKMDTSSGGAFRRLAMWNATQLLWTMMSHGLLPRHEISPDKK